MNFLGLYLWLNFGRALLATAHAVTNTVLGDLHVLLIHVHTHTLPQEFSVFYRAGQTTYHPSSIGVESPVVSLEEVRSGPMQRVLD